MTATYLSPKRFRFLGTGVDLSEITDDRILPSLVVASAMTNRYCATPVDHDFRGGLVTDERHVWNPGNNYRVGTQRIWPLHRPIKSVDHLQIDVTNTQYVSVSGSSLYMNPQENWIEPVSLGLTPIGLFGLGVLPALGLHEPVTKLTYEYGWEFTAVDEPLASYSGSMLMAPDQFWTDDDVVIKMNGTAMAEADYEIDHYEGMVTVSGYDAEAMYSASYGYTLPRPIGLATALIATDVMGQQGLVGRGLVGLSSLQVEEISMRVSMRSGISNVPVNGAAASLLDPFVYLSWG